MKYLSKLNPQQNKAVVAGAGQFLVLAGPGSGKTRVLTQRIAYLIGHLGIRPYHILAVTFTNKAAKEMNRRVVALLKQDTHGLTLGTFHATCSRILRREADNLPFKSNFVIFDADDQISVVKSAIKELNLDDKTYRPHGIHAVISRAKNELILPDDFPVLTYRDELVKRVYEVYQRILLNSNALDFDDLLLWTAYLLEEYPVVREKLARRFEHVLVDEFQDTNYAQYVMLKYLAYFHHNVFVVGDIDQSIYRWRGADYRNVARFQEDFPDAQVILLEQNYRSTQTVLDIAMAVIDQNPNRIRKRLFTEKGVGKKAILHETFDDREEAIFVIDTISKNIALKGANPGDFAVMYRTNAQSRLLEEAFLSAGLPYKLVGAQRFYGRREIKDVIAYLRMVHNLDDEISLSRVINTPTRGIGSKTLILLRTHAQKVSLSQGELLIDLASGDLSPHGKVFPKRAASALSKFGVFLKRWRAERDKYSPLELLDYILDDVNYRGYLDDGTDQGRERWENVMELRRLAADYKEYGLEQFLENVALVSDQDTIDDTANVPTLLTLHAAKGLEFPIVIIIGLNEGVLPHKRSFDDPEAMHEERRLFYVGITRAKIRLFFVYSLNRSLYGYSEPASPSRYLDDIPLDLFDHGRFGYSMTWEPSKKTRQDRWETSEKEQIIKMDPKYAPSMKVEHSVWGHGMVLNSRIQDDDEIVEVFFESVGLKRVVASIANLDILD